MRNLNRAVTFSLGTLGVLAATSTLAAIESVDGSIVRVPRPPSVEEGQYVSDTELRIFTEAKNLVLPHDVTVNISLPGTYSGPNPVLTPAILPAGTQVNSYFLHFDTSVDKALEGRITFKGKIVGIIVDTPELDSSDSLSQAATVYPTGTNSSRSVLTGQQGIDTLTLDAIQKTLNVTLWVGNGALDQMRILTIPSNACDAVKYSSVNQQITFDTLAMALYNPITDEPNGQFALFAGTSMNLTALPGFYDFEYGGGNPTYTGEIVVESDNCYPTYSAQQETVHFPKIEVPLVGVLPDGSTVDGPSACYEAQFQQATTQASVFSLTEVSEVACQ